MKLIYRLLPVVLFSILLFSGCKKYNEQTFDFSTSAPPYVALKTYTAKTVVQGNMLSFILVVRTAIQEPVTVAYQITGNFTLSGTYTLPRNTLEGTVSVVIPPGTVPVGSSAVTGTLKLITATSPNTKIIVGRITPASEKFSVTVTP
ncbi:MAG: hypothetical protein H7320_22375 [Ferruginibacter sp.]|nr:hypothetical protein [Ferruginibacter sp.]